MIPTVASSGKPEPISAVADADIALFVESDLEARRQALRDRRLQRLREHLRRGGCRGDGSTGCKNGASARIDHRLPSLVVVAAHARDRWRPALKPLATRLRDCSERSRPDHDKRPQPSLRGGQRSGPVARPRNRPPKWLHKHAPRIVAFVRAVSKPITTGFAGLEKFGVSAGWHKAGAVCRYGPRAVPPTSARANR
jgi:hypothetical protein